MATDSPTLDCRIPSVILTNKAGGTLRLVVEFLDRDEEMDVIFEDEIVLTAQEDHEIHEVPDVDDPVRFRVTVEAGLEETDWTTDTRDMNGTLGSGSMLLADIEFSRIFYDYVSVARRTACVGRPM